MRGRPQPRTLLVFGREPGSLRGIYASGGVGFLHDMLDIAGGVERLRRRRARVGAAVDRDVLARAPEVILELRATGLLAAADVAQAKRVWGALRVGSGGAATGASRSCTAISSSCPGRASSGRPRRSRAALHPEAFK